MSNPIEQRRKADAWVQGFLFGYYLERGYSVAQATELAREDVPDHLRYQVPVWNPYDPETVDPTDVEPFAFTPDDEIKTAQDRLRETHPEIWQAWLDWIDSRTSPRETCTTTGCPGDVRYAAPGRGHWLDCRYPTPETFKARCLECEEVREISTDATAPLTDCPNCGNGFIKAL